MQPAATSLSLSLSLSPSDPISVHSQSEYATPQGSQSQQHTSRQLSAPIDFTMTESDNDDLQPVSAGPSRSPHKVTHKTIKQSLSQRQGLSRLARRSNTSAAPKSPSKAYASAQKLNEQREIKAFFNSIPANQRASGSRARRTSGKGTEADPCVIDDGSSTSSDLGEINVHVPGLQPKNAPLAALTSPQSATPSSRAPSSARGEKDLHKDALNTKAFNSRLALGRSSHGLTADIKPRPRELESTPKPVAKQKSTATPIASPSKRLGAFGSHGKPTRLETGEPAIGRPSQGSSTPIQNSRAAFPSKPSTSTHRPIPVPRRVSPGESNRSSPLSFLSRTASPQRTQSPTRSTVTPSPMNPPLSARPSRAHIFAHRDIPQPKRPRLDFEDESYRPPQSARPVTPHHPSSSAERPKRARLDAGAYAVPTIDAEEWPSVPGSTAPAITRSRRPRTSYHQAPATNHKVKTLTVHVSSPPPQSDDTFHSLFSDPGSSLSPESSPVRSSGPHHSVNVEQDQAGEEEAEEPVEEVEKGEGTETVEVEAEPQADEDVDLFALYAEFDNPASPELEDDLLLAEGDVDPQGQREHTDSAAARAVTPPPRDGKTTSQGAAPGSGSHRSATKSIHLTPGALARRVLERFEHAGEAKARAKQVAERLAEERRAMRAKMEEEEEEEEEEESLGMDITRAIANARKANEARRSEQTESSRPSRSKNHGIDQTRVRSDIRKKYFNDSATRQVDEMFRERRARERRGQVTGADVERAFRSLEESAAAAAAGGSRKGARDAYPTPVSGEEGDTDDDGSWGSRGSRDGGSRSGGRGGRGRGNRVYRSEGDESGDSGDEGDRLLELRRDHLHFQGEEEADDGIARELKRAREDRRQSRAAKKAAAIAEEGVFWDRGDHTKIPKASGPEMEMEMGMEGVEEGKEGEPQVPRLGLDEEVSEVAQLLRDETDPKEVALMIGSGMHLACAQDEMRAIALWLVDIVLVSTDEELVSCAASSLGETFAMCSENIFGDVQDGGSESDLILMAAGAKGEEGAGLTPAEVGSQAFLALVVDLFRGVGAKSAVLETVFDQVPGDSAMCVRDRDSVCKVVCQLVDAAARCDWINPAGARALVTLFILVAADPGTPLDTLEYVHEVYNTLWTRCLVDVDAVGCAKELVAMFNGAGRVPRGNGHKHEGTGAGKGNGKGKEKEEWKEEEEGKEVDEDGDEELPTLSTQSMERIVQAIGQVQPEAKAVRKWVAIAFLVPGCLEDTDLGTVPSAELLSSAVDQVIDDVVHSLHGGANTSSRIDTDYDALAARTRMLFAASMDMDALVVEAVRKSGKSMAVEELRRRVKYAHTRIPDLGTIHPRAASVKTSLLSLNNTLLIKYKAAKSRRTAARVSATGILAVPSGHPGVLGAGAAVVTTTMAGTGGVSAGLGARRAMEMDRVANNVEQTRLNFGLARGT